MKICTPWFFFFFIIKNISLCRSMVTRSDSQWCYSDWIGLWTGYYPIANGSTHSSLVCTWIRCCTIDAVCALVLLILCYHTHVTYSVLILVLRPSLWLTISQTDQQKQSLPTNSCAVTHSSDRCSTSACPHHSKVWWGWWRYGNPSHDTQRNTTQTTTQARRSRLRPSRFSEQGHWTFG